jgi:hypothetical protein
VKISRCRGYLTARMRFGHPHVPAPLRHLLAALPLRRRHRCIGHHTRHHRQRGEQYRQSENSNFLREVQRHECRRNSELDATGSEKIQVTAVTRSPTQHPCYCVFLCIVLFMHEKFPRVKTECNRVHEGLQRKKTACCLWHHDAGPVPHFSRIC